MGSMQLDDRTMAKLTSVLLDKQHLATDIDARDVRTPDDWVPRHPALVRLTGNHPFNCEPPCDMLLDQGFITPVSLHYVRNHGKVPKLQWDSHAVSISGLVDKPLTLSMDQLAAMPTVSMPVTLVCAGNRRKEQNMTKQTIGFSWGISAHACNVWKGVRLADLLRLAGVQMDKAKHVEFVGAKVEGLPNGTYGTSIPMPLAMDAYGDVMIAFEQNGMRLSPDHGYPLRVVIPGWIGGRMVKWLENIVVTDKPSDNFYHFFDNRIMPPHVDAELAKAEGWWYRPEYLFNELNINSAINYPNNGEFMAADEDGQYTIKGYAYSGGGRKITRVELSMDAGKTWSLCDVDYPEERFSHAPSNGKYWCWMHWEYKVDKADFVSTVSNSGELRCRAWDEGNNTQPDKLTWNLMGMGNNCHFVVKVQPFQSADPDAPQGIEFLHPTVPGPAKGGWMPPPETSAAAAAAAKALEEKKKQKAGGEKVFSMAEVAKHTSKESAWFVMDGAVYDATSYLKDHPGGAESILMNTGMDATEDFLAIHSDSAKTLLEDFRIGVLETGSAATSRAAAVTTTYAASASDELVALDQRKWQDFELIERVELSRDTRLFKFKLPSAQHRLGLPVGHHMLIQGKVDGKAVIRAYTPVSSDDNLGVFMLCIKVYFANSHPKFPNGGKLSQYMEALNVGENLRVKGPLGHFEYCGMGNVVLREEKRTVKRLGFLCGGTGITPAYQVMRAIAKNPDDTTEVYLIYANQTEGDILLREEIDGMAAERDNIHVWYTVDRPPEAGWMYGTGFVTEEMIREHLPACSPDVMVGMCGPPAMLNQACIPNLIKLDFTDNDYFAF